MVLWFIICHSVNEGTHRREEGMREDEEVGVSKDKTEGGER